MTASESVCTFTCAGETLFGVVAAPPAPGELGVVIVVGGPQYRAGSHRQFVLLARDLAASGYATLRFDYRGMGDSEGDQRDFTAVDADIDAAVTALQRAQPSVRRVVLWGLCDAASAALIACAARPDARIAGLCLLNPWVRSEVSLAKTQVKHYYGQRLLDARFWRKLLGGQVEVTASLRELAGKLRSAAKSGAAPAVSDAFQTRMAKGLAGFAGAVLLILSGNDHTAREFVEYARSDPAWSGLLGKTKRIDIADADHTFSSAAWRAAVAEATATWLATLAEQAA